VKYTYRLLKTALKAPQGELSQVQPDFRSLQTIFRLDAGPVLKMSFAERYGCFYKVLDRFWHCQSCHSLCFDLSFFVFVLLFRVGFFEQLVCDPVHCDLLRNELRTCSAHYSSFVAFILYLIRPVNQAAFLRAKTWLVADIAILVQFFNALMVRSDRCDLGKAHQLPAADGKGLGEALPLPANK